MTVCLPFPSWRIGRCQFVHPPPEFQTNNNGTLPSIPQLSTETSFVKKPRARQGGGSRPGRLSTPKLRERNRREKIWDSLLVSGSNSLAEMKRLAAVAHYRILTTKGSHGCERQMKSNAMCRAALLGLLAVALGCEPLARAAASVAEVSRSAKRPRIDFVREIKPLLA